MKYSWGLKLVKLTKSRTKMLFRNLKGNARRKSLPLEIGNWRWHFKSCGLFDFLTCDCINFSKNKYSYLKSKEINVGDENKVHIASCTYRRRLIHDNSSKQLRLRSCCFQVISVLFSNLNWKTGTSSWGPLYGWSLLCDHPRVKDSLTPISIRALLPS